MEDSYAILAVGSKTSGLILKNNYRGIAGYASTDCLVSVESILKPWRRGEVTIVDVRDPSKFGNYRIPGAINIPEFVVRTKAFLQPKNVVLVNDGRNHNGLLHTCQRLKETGFKQISVLDGGLRVWIKHAIPLAGIQPSQAELSYISPREFLQAQHERNWILIHVDPDKNNLIELFSGFSVIPYDEDVTVLGAAIQNATKHMTEGDLVGILMVSSSGEVYPDISRILQHSPIDNILYLKGGIEALRDFLTQRQAQIAQRTRDPKRSKRCGG